MKYFLLLLTLTLSLIAQNAYSDKKIDMHGGNHNTLGSNGGGFRNSTMDMSMLLDRNASKNTHQKSDKVK